jgi:hypothetical protein
LLLEILGDLGASIADIADGRSTDRSESFSMASGAAGRKRVSR